ncbi:hypothetical protein IW261DRAFT_1344040, partial [Armillaria novae-zelandiae]
VHRLPNDLKRMIKTARECNVCLDGLAISHEIQCQMLVWYHIKSTAMRHLFNSGEQVKCLKNQHKVVLVGNAERLAKYLDNEQHSRGRCRCTACHHARTEPGCSSPHKCFQKVKNLLESLTPKWNPLIALPNNVSVPLMDDDVDKPDGQANYFQPCLVMTGSLSDAFRIFVEGNECPHMYNAPIQDPTRLQEMIAVYTDGSAIKTGTREAAAGAGVFYGDNDERNKSIHLPNEIGKTSQASEIIGAKMAAEDTLTTIRMDLFSNSKHVLDSLSNCFIK